MIWVCWLAVPIGFHFESNLYREAAAVSREAPKIIRSATNETNDDCFDVNREKNSVTRAITVLCP